MEHRTRPGGTFVFSALLLFLGLTAACADLALEDQAFRCANDDDCLYGRVCVDGACRPSEDPPGEDTSEPPSCEDGVCNPNARQTEACGACGTHERMCGADCQWGEWGDCGDEGACEPGAVGSETCGACGTQALLCDDTCAWQPDGACVEDGVCQPEAEETLPCARCGVQRRTCTDACVWGPWALCEEQGPCDIGDDEEETCGSCGVRGRICDATCAWSEWGPCLGEGECAAEAEETEPCGDCGERRRTCSDTCTWSHWGPCEGEGECTPDALGTEACGKCGERNRTCSDACSWSAWSECAGEGECTALDEATVPCGECGSRSRSCTTACSWTPWSDCDGAPECVGSETCAAHGVCLWRVVEIEFGTVLMGSPDGVGTVSERPEHAVVVPAFAIDRFEVSASDFATFLNAEGNADASGNEYLDADDEDAPLEFTAGVWVPKRTCQRFPNGPFDAICAFHPVYEVSWYGAHDYCAWLGARLPSEAEWERAAAGLGSATWPWGDVAPGPTLANCEEGTCADGFATVAPVGLFPGGVSAAGVDDLAGNVAEWVEDWFHPTYADAPQDGSAWLVPPSSVRVVRGGAATDGADPLRAAYRAGWPPSQTPDTPIGFRCAWDR